MNSILRNLAKEYIKNVDEVCQVLIESLNLKSKVEFWEYRRTHFALKYIVNNLVFTLHGRGCRVTSNDYFIDWDFGHGSRWCGLEPWLLARTLENNKNENYEFYDGGRIREEFDKAVLSGEMMKKNDRYYFKLPLEDSFIPKFPKEYDTLIIQQGSLQRIIKRNKKIDKFIRKAQRIYRHTFKGVDTYILLFNRDGEEIFTIEYDDIAYPERAVQLMYELINEYDREMERKS